MNLRLVGDRLPSSRSRRGIDVRRWVTGLASGAVVLASGIIGMAPSSAVACGSATTISTDVRQVSVTSNCDWAVPSGVTVADVIVVGGGGASGSYGDGPSTGPQKLCASNGGGGGNVVLKSGFPVTGKVSVTVGVGGSGGAAGAAGGSSVFGSLTATGGSGGAGVGNTLAAATGTAGGGSVRPSDQAHCRPFRVERPTRC